MNPETLKILNEADDPVEWEAPAYFDWNESMAQVRALKPKLERVIGRTLEVDDGVQDASYFSQVFLLSSVEHDNPQKLLLNIHFSNFGKLFTIWSDCSSNEFSSEMSEQVRKLIENDGFRFVNSSELGEDYAGVHEGLRENYVGGDKYSWAVRFFGYL